MSNSHTTVHIHAGCKPYPPSSTNCQGWWEVRRVQSNNSIHVHFLAHSFPTWFEHIPVMEGVFKLFFFFSSHPSTVSALWSRVPALLQYVQPPLIIKCKRRKKKKKLQVNDANWLLVMVAVAQSDLTKQKGLRSNTSSGGRLELKKEATLQLSPTDVIIIPSEEIDSDFWINSSVVWISSQIQIWTVRMFPNANMLYKAAFFPFFPHRYITTAVNLKDPISSNFDGNGESVSSGCRVLQLPDLSSLLFQLATQSLSAPPPNVRQVGKITRGSHACTSSSAAVRCIC